MSLFLWLLFFVKFLFTANDLHSKRRGSVKEIAEQIKPVVELRLQNRELNKGIESIYLFLSKKEMCVLLCVRRGL